MNVLFLTYSYLPNVGGVERSVFNLARRLEARGHDVTVVTHSYWSIPFRYRRGRTPRVLEMHIPSQTVYPLFARMRRTLINIVNGITLTLFCVLRRIDVVHCHHLNTDTIYGRYLARLLGIPFVLTVRGGETTNWIHSEKRRRYVIDRLRDAPHVTAVSSWLLSEATELVPELAGKSSVVPNPVDADALAATVAEAGTDPPGPYLIFAGRLGPEKDVECLIDAYHAVVRTDPAFGADLVVVGEGPRREELESRARAGVGANRIAFLGERSYPATLRLIERATALVLPSRGYEGCPNVLLEAMALGTPAIVSDLPSLLELVDDGVNGVVFACGDSQALADHLCALVGDESTREAMVKAARERLRARHAFGPIASRYEEIYSGVVRGAAAAAMTVSRR